MLLMAKSRSSDRRRKLIGDSDRFEGTRFSKSPDSAMHWVLRSSAGCKIEFSHDQDPEKKLASCRWRVFDECAFPSVVLPTNVAHHSLK